MSDVTIPLDGSPIDRCPWCGAGPLVEYSEGSSVACPRSAWATRAAEDLYGDPVGCPAPRFGRVDRDAAGRLVLRLDGDSEAAAVESLRRQAEAMALDAVKWETRHHAAELALAESAGREASARADLIRSEALSRYRAGVAAEEREAHAAARVEVRRLRWASVPALLLAAVAVGALAWGLDGPELATPATERQVMLWALDLHARASTALTWLGVATVAGAGVVLVLVGWDAMRRTVAPEEGA